MKYLIISHNQHQLEKGLFLKKNYPEKIDVIITSTKINSKNVNDDSKNFKYKEISQIIDYVENYQKFIFFSVQPKTNLIALIKKIRLQKKEIIQFTNIPPFLNSQKVENALIEFSSLYGFVFLHRLLPI